MINAINALTSEQVLAFQVLLSGKTSIKTSTEAKKQRRQVKVDYLPEIAAEFKKKYPFS